VELEITISKVKISEHRVLAYMPEDLLVKICLLEHQLILRAPADMEK
jgi:hypothetical protein